MTAKTAEEFANANRDFFDKFAAHYNDKPWQQEMSRKIVRDLRDKASFIGLEPVERDEAGNPKREVKMLDYACGPGMVSRALAPYVSRAIGIDLSPNMVAAYNAAFAAPPPPGEPRLDAHAHTADLLTDDPPATLNGADHAHFDIAAVSLAFHHFADPARAAQRLAARLAPGGVLLVVDICAGEGEIGAAAHGHAHSHGHGHDHDQGAGASDAHDGAWLAREAQHTIGHRGFTPDALRGMFAAAGLTAFGWSEALETTDMPEGDAMVRRRIFYARAEKPAAVASSL